MMPMLLLAPHNDDESLFAAFTVLRYRPVVATVFKSVKQERDGIEAKDRELETIAALCCLGQPFTGEQWPIPDDSPNDQARIAVRSILETQRTHYSHVFAPAPLEGGHEQHNLVGEEALAVFGPERVTLYMTYRRGEGRTVSEWEVPFEPEWPSAKLSALAAYVSQICHPPTAPWFLELLPMREYYAHEPRDLHVPGMEDILTADEFLAEHQEEMLAFGERARVL